MRKKDDNTIYRLYKDTKIKLTSDFYLKPLAGLASSSLALAIANNMDLDNDLAMCVSIGMATFFGLSTIKKVKLYNKIKKEYDSRNAKLNEFREDLQKVIGTEYNLNSDNIAIMPHLGIGMGNVSLNIYDTIFLDTSKISEIIENGVYSCLFYKDKDLYNYSEEAIDITDIAKKVLERQ